MEKKDLIITVSGQVASGKSRLTYLLKKFLSEHGFEVEFEANLDHPTESDFDKHMSKNLDEVIENFKDTRKITLKEVQLNNVITLNKLKNTN
jgi:deoxyadenosine/deoxycytidine kinase